MLDFAHAFLSGLSLFGWFTLVLAWAFLVALIFIRVLDDDAADGQFMRERLFDEAEWVAEQLDYAVSAIGSSAPAWYPEEAAERYRFAMAELSETAGRHREVPDDLRARIDRTEVGGLPALVRSHLPAAESLAYEASRIQEECRELAVSRLIECTLETAERRLRQLGEAARQLSLPPLVMGAVASSLGRIGNECRSVRKSFGEEAAIGEDDLLLVAKASTELNDLHDLLAWFAVRRR